MIEVGYCPAVESYNSVAVHTLLTVGCFLFEAEYVMSFVVVITVTVSFV